MKEKYYFYYDESFYDAAITSKPKGELNIEAEDASDTFCSVVIGISKLNVKNFEKDYLAFENKIKQSFPQFKNIPEIKGTTFQKKYYKYGFQSFDSRLLKVYNDLFDILEKHKMIVHINLLSKIELILLNILDKNSIDNRILYGIIKLIYNYKSKIIAPILFNEELTDENFLENFKNFLSGILNEISSSSKKRKESQMIKEILNYLEKEDILTIKNKYPWDHSYSFENFFTYIKKQLELSPKQIYLYVDGEENETNKTFVAAKNMNFINVEAQDSKNSIGIRCADLLANLFGRMTKFISNELYTDWDNPNSKKYISKKTILNEKWFELNINQLALYEKIDCFFNNNTVAISHGIFFDTTIFVTTLFKYLSLYTKIFRRKNIQENNFKDYINPEYFNKFLVKFLEICFRKSFLTYERDFDIIKNKS